MRKRKRNWMNNIKWTFACMMVCVFLYFLLGEFLLPKEQIDDFSCKEFVAKWYQIKEDGTREPIQIPGSCKAERGENKIIEKTFPKQWEEKTDLCFRS